MKIYLDNCLLDILLVTISQNSIQNFLKKNVINTTICGQCGFITTPKMMFFIFHVLTVSTKKYLCKIILLILKL